MKLRCIFIIYTLLFFPLANSQELEPNGDFDNDITGWHCGNGMPTWISNDGSSLSGNGSLQHTIGLPSASGGELSAGYCDFSTVVAGRSYIFKGSYKMLNAQEMANISLNLYYYTQNEVYIDVTSEVIPISSIMLNQWTSFTITSLAPANSGKIISSLSYHFTTTGNPVDISVRWDDMSLKQKKSIIFLDGFE